MFRIPDSPRCKWKGFPGGPTKPVFYLQHGLMSSSDCWVLSGPSRALGFQLADACYDVWLGNSRGNRYARKNTKLSASDRDFWKFTWHHIGYNDVAAQINYVLVKTGHRALHFVGHSQGTTGYLVLMSLRPDFLKKLKTSHLLAPVAFCGSMRSVMFSYGSQVLLHLPDFELPGHYKPLATLISYFCSFPIAALLCKNVLFLYTGAISRHMDKLLTDAITITHPAGSSSRQIKHFAQLHSSHKFRNFDFGETENMKIYGTATPPEYPLNRIKPSEPVNIYYSDDDVLAAVSDVLLLSQNLPHKRVFRVQADDWTHLDFIFAHNLRTVIGNQIIALSHAYEKRHSGKKLNPHDAVLHSF
ncbi:lipase 3-like [Scaptodrosophila lebanonensis]|uniref:Lipase 3-like n=1 Tax=Drosophila lebanonensis TaxID=7225 RepID=A0A6J2T7S4_DROLE|nr:lipase 3-like [Scaptodrosophila lebanonensis]